MPAENVQKLKILYLLRMLWTETDAEQGLTMTQILTKLGELGITAERKSIYRDIAALRDFGVDITTYRRMPVEYAVVKHDFSFGDVTMLVDAVQGSRFLTERKSRQLVRGLKGLASVRERSLLDRRVHVAGRIRSQSESVYHNVDTIHEAIAAKRKVQFLYCRYGTDLELHPTLDAATGRAKLYVQTPVKVAFVGGFYYLAAWCDEREQMLTFRLDRMRLLQTSDEKATRNDVTRAYAYEDFEYQAFDMYDGQPAGVTLRVKAAGMGVIVDRFGRDVVVTDAVPEEGGPAWSGACDVHVTVRLSPLFHGWLASMRDIICLTAPASAVEAHRAWVAGLMGE